MADEFEAYEKKIGITIAIIIGLSLLYYVIYMNFLCDFKHQDFLNDAGKIDWELYSSMEGTSCSDFTHKPATHILVVVMLYGITEYMIWQSRYYMPQVTVNGYHGSILMRPEVVGPWVIISVGKNLFPVPLPITLGTLVVPRTHLQRAGNNLIGLTYVEKINIDHLPEEVNTHIFDAADKYNKKNVFFGVYTEGFIKMNEEILDYHRLWKSQNKRINELNHLLEGRYDSFQEVVNITDKLSRRRKGIFGVLTGDKKKDDEE